MIPLLKMYDDFTSNRGVSLGISFASTAFMAYRTVTYICNTNPTTFVISACAGVALALLSRTYLIHNDAVKSEGERNSIYATLSLFTVFAPVGHQTFYNRVVQRKVMHLFEFYGCRFYNSSFLNGLGLGFTATNLALQLMDGQTKIKFQSPFVFE